MRAIAAIIAFAATCWAPPVPVSDADLVTFYHADRPHVAPLRNIISTGETTVLIDGTVYEEFI